MLAGLLWPSILLAAYAVFVWYLWRETTLEIAPATPRSLPLPPSRVDGVGETDIGVHGKQFGMTFSPHP